MNRKRVVITGYGLFSALGHDPELFHDNLFKESVCGPPEHFDCSDCQASEAFSIGTFDAQEHLGDVNVRPLNRIARFSVIAAQEALKHACLSEGLREANDVGLVLGTQYCSLGTLTQFDRKALKLGPKYASPLDFANTVINAAAGQTALWHQLRGPNSTIAAGAGSGLNAIGYAFDLIAQGRARTLLAGGAEELSQENFFSFDRAGLLATEAEDGVPFSGSSSGFYLGEGAGFVVLEDFESAKARHATIYGEILGFATGYDLSMATDLTSFYEAQLETLEQATAQAGIAAADLACVMASANGGKDDTSEERALAFFLQDSDAQVAAPKAQFGEALGASGPLSVIAALTCLKAGQIPGIPGYIEGSEGLSLTRLSEQAHQIHGRAALVNGHSYDGAISTLILAVGEDHA